MGTPPLPDDITGEDGKPAGHDKRTGEGPVFRRIVDLEGDFATCVRKMIVDLEVAFADYARCRARRRLLGLPPVEEQKPVWGALVLDIAAKTITEQMGEWPVDRDRMLTHLRQEFGLAVPTPNVTADDDANGRSSSSGSGIRPIVSEEEDMAMT